MIDDVGREQRLVCVPHATPQGIEGFAEVVIAPNMAEGRDTETRRVEVQLFFGSAFDKLISFGRRTNGLLFL